MVANIFIKANFNMSKSFIYYLNPLFINDCEKPEILPV